MKNHRYYESLDDDDVTYDRNFNYEPDFDDPEYADDAYLADREALIEKHYKELEYERLSVDREGFVEDHANATVLQKKDEIKTASVHAIKKLVQHNKQTESAEIKGVSSMNRPMRNISDSVILQEFKTLRDTIEKRFDEQDELNKMWFHVLGEQTAQTNKALKSKDGNSGASEMALDGIAEVFSVVLNNQNVLLKAKTESDRRIAEMQAELKALQSQNEKLQNTLDVYHSQSKTKSEIVDAELTKLHRLGCIMLALVVFIAIITCYFLLDVAH